MNKPKTAWDLAGCVLLIVFILQAGSGAVETTKQKAGSPTNSAVFDEAIEIAKVKLANTFKTQNDLTQFPRNTDEKGKWTTRESRNWTSGFFPGCLWYMYELTGDEAWMQKARVWTDAMEAEKSNTQTHDIGFMMFCSFGNGYRLTGDGKYKEVILESAKSLSTRYNPAVGCTLSWSSKWAQSRWKFAVIVDNMMNLEILLWAARNGGDKKLYEISASHAAKTMQNHIRADHSTWHVVDYDPNTGKVIKKQTLQGYSDDSCWARGQAWGTYGFTMAYRETGDERFLKTAQRLADYFIEHLPEDNVPYWDFQAPGPNEPRDTSAGAIAASAMLELSGLVKDSQARQKYFEAAEKILKSLSSPAYLDRENKTDGVLLHGTGAKPLGREIDVSLIYGDYYFLEALVRYKKITKL